jgi:hypothetical protein
MINVVAIIAKGTVFYTIKLSQHFQKRKLVNSHSPSFHLNSFFAQDLASWFAQVRRYRLPTKIEFLTCRNRSRLFVFLKYTLKYVVHPKSN